MMMGASVLIMITSLFPMGVAIAAENSGHIRTANRLLLVTLLMWGAALLLGVSWGKSQQDCAVAASCSAHGRNTVSNPSRLVLEQSKKPTLQKRAA